MMTDLFTNLARQALGDTQAMKPFPVSRFGPAPTILTNTPFDGTGSGDDVNAAMGSSETGQEWVPPLAPLIAPDDPRFNAPVPTFRQMAAAARRAAEAERSEPALQAPLAEEPVAPQRSTEQEGVSSATVQSVTAPPTMSLSAVQPQTVQTDAFRSTPQPAAPRDALSSKPAPLKSVAPRETGAESDRSASASSRREQSVLADRLQRGTANPVSSTIEPQPLEPALAAEAITTKRDGISRPVTPTTQPERSGVVPPADSEPSLPAPTPVLSGVEPQTKSRETIRPTPLEGSRGPGAHHSNAIIEPARTIEEIPDIPKSPASQEVQPATRKVPPDAQEPHSLGAPHVVDTPRVVDARDVSEAPPMVNVPERRPTGDNPEHIEPVILPRLSEPRLLTPVADPPRRASPAPVPELLPTVRIRIGRIEVRSAETPAPPPARKSAPPRTSLAEYLKSQARSMP